MSQQPDNQNNLLIAVVLSMAVMLGWQYFYAGPQMKAQQEKAAREKQEQGQKAGRRALRRRQRATRGSRRTARHRTCRDTRGSDRAFAAHCHRDAVAQGLDRAQGRAHRRPRAREVSRDRRPQEPQRRRCSRRSTAPTPISPSTAGSSARNSTQKVPDRETLWTRRRRRGAADAQPHRSRSPGTTARASSSGARSRSTTTTCSRSPTRSRTRPPATSRWRPTRASIASASRRPQVIRGSCTRA